MKIISITLIFLLIFSCKEKIDKNISKVAIEPTNTENSIFSGMYNLLPRPYFNYDELGTTNGINTTIINRDTTILKFNHSKEDKASIKKLLENMKMSFNFYSQDSVEVLVKYKEEPTEKEYYMKYSTIIQNYKYNIKKDSLMIIGLGNFAYTKKSEDSILIFDIKNKLSSRKKLFLVKTRRIY